MTSLKEECDHDWKKVDDSFDHEFGTKVIIYERCQLCDETRPFDLANYYED
jgi:hypothetical protein